MTNSNNNSYYDENTNYDDPCYRCTYNYIPHDIKRYQNIIPVTFSVEFDKKPLPVANENLVRCQKCLGYVNCYSTVVNPGYKWVCNLCNTMNEVLIPFQFKDKNFRSGDRFEYNSNTFVSSALTSKVYEIEAPDNYLFGTSRPPTLIFLIEVTSEANRNNLLSSVVNCIKESLANNDLDSRTRACFIFFNSCGYVLAKNDTMLVIDETIPKILPDEVFYSIKKDQPDNIFDIDYQNILDYFSSTTNQLNNILPVLYFISRTFRQGSIFAFISSLPNIDKSKIAVSSAHYQNNENYKKVSQDLYLRNLGVNLFACTRQSLELGVLKVLTTSGGQLFHYSNYDGSEPVYTDKLYCDLNEIFNNRINYNCWMKIRLSEGCNLKALHGNFVQRKNGVFAYSNFSPSHAINFEISIPDKLETVYAQIAMLRINKEGIRSVRVFNIQLLTANSSTPTVEIFNAKQIIMALTFNACYQESLKKFSGGYYIDRQINSIVKEMKISSGGIINENIRPCISYALAMRKSIALRPDKHTPNDFRVFYIYLLSNMCFSTVDSIVYPTLINLLDPEPTVYSLTRTNLRDDSIYLMDAGITLFCYVGKNCTNLDCFNNLDTLISGLSLYNITSKNEFGNYMNNWIAYFNEGRLVKPKFVLVLEKESSNYLDVFRSYFYDDQMYNLPDIFTYENSLGN